MQALNKGPGWLRASRQSFREGAMQKKAPETTQPVPVEVDFGAYRVGDPEEFGRNMLKLMEEGSKLLSDLLGRSNGNGGPYSMASETSEADRKSTRLNSSH